MPAHTPLTSVPCRFSRTVVAPGDQLSVESRLLQGMASCHSLTLIGGEVRGDPLDCRMFQATKWVCVLGVPGPAFALLLLLCKLKDPSQLHSSSNLNVRSG